MYFFLSVVLIAAIPAVTFAQFGIDSPLPGSTQSGAVAPPNGWKCSRKGEITARIDGGSALSFNEDQSRIDTTATCGNSGSNGFSLFPFNWNTSGDGPHTIEVFDAGEKFAEVSFEVVAFGTEFLVGATGSCVIPDFPDPGADVEVSWDPAIQNFRITQVIAPPPAITSPLCPFQG